MKNYMETAKKLLQKEPLDLRDFLDSVYEFCEKRIDRNNIHLKQCSEELDRLLESLPFDQQDELGCACMALCSEYEYTAFTDGFQKGAFLILSLL